MSKFSWSSPYDRIVGASKQRWKMERNELGATLTGSLAGVVVECREISMSVNFLYKSHQIKSLGEYCDFVDMKEEAQTYLNSWDLDRDSEGEIRATCVITHKYAVLCKSASNSLFMTRLFGYDQDATKDYKRYAGLDDREVFNGVVYSSHFTDDENADRHSNAEATFVNASSRLNREWRDTLTLMNDEVRRGRM